MRSVEPGLAAVLLGFRPQPDDRERGDAEQHRDGEEVLQEAEPSQRPMNGMWKSSDEQQGVRLQVDRREDEEAPHGEEVGDAGNRPPQQPGLPEDLFDLGGDARTEVVLAAVLVAGRLAGPDQVRQPHNALRGERQHDRCHQQADDEPDQHLRIHRVPPVSKVTQSNLLHVTGQ